MRHQYIVRQVFVIISILAFLWLFQKVTEALDFGEEVLDDVNMKAKMEERQIHKDEIFVKGSPDVEADENENIEDPKEAESESYDEDNIDREEKEKLVKSRVIEHDLDEFRVDIENKIDGPTSNISKGGSDDLSQNKNSKLNSKTLKVVEPDIDLNQEAGRKRVDDPAKSKVDAAGGLQQKPKRGPKHRADKKLQIMKPDESHDMEAGRKKIAEENHDVYSN